MEDREKILKKIEELKKEKSKIIKGKYANSAQLEKALVQVDRKLAEWESKLMPG